MAYRETSTKILFNMIDETAKEDAAFDYSHSPIKQWCNIDNLINGGRNNNYLTNEHNYSVLDGSLPDRPYFDNYAFVSDFTSNEDREFDNEYYFRIIFDEPHTTNGITITFDGDYFPDVIRVVYYDSTLNNHRIINSREFVVDEDVFFCDGGMAIENFKEIRIYFISTKFPNSLIKMSKLEFGANYVWGDENIVHAEIFEETDIISNTMSMDSLRFTIYSDDDDFNIDNPQNIYAVLKKNQKVEVYEYIYL